MEMAFYYPFILLVERPKGFQCREKTVLFKAKSSHLLVRLIRENHNINLIHILQCNEIPSVFKHYEQYFFGLHVDHCLSIIIENSSEWYQNWKSICMTIHTKLFCHLKAEVSWHCSFSKIQVSYKCHMILEKF